jgi:hypothetical protein
MMRERVNHKSQSEKVKVDSHFWEEYRQRGFKVDPTQGGSFHSEIKTARFAVKGQGQYEIAVDEKSKFNIVSAAMFMKTVAQIEGLVKYKLFK